MKKIDPMTHRCTRYIKLFYDAPILDALESHTRLIKRDSILKMNIARIVQILRILIAILILAERSTLKIKLLRHPLVSDDLRDFLTQKCVALVIRVITSHNSTHVNASGRVLITIQPHARVSFFD